MSADLVADLSGLQRHVDRVEALLHGLQVEEPSDERSGDAPGRVGIPEPPETSSPTPSDVLTTIIRRFGLSGHEADLLRIAIVAEFEPDIADSFAQLQGDRRMRRARFDFILRMIESDPQRRSALVSLLHENQVLRRFHLLEPLPDGVTGSQLITEQIISADHDITFQVAGSEEPTSRWPNAFKLVHPEAGLESLVLPDKTKKMFEALLALSPGDEERHGGRVGSLSTRRLLLYFHGEYGTGRQKAAEVLARAWGLNALMVDCRMIPDDMLGSPHFPRIALRDAIRLGAMPVFLHVERLAAAEPRKGVSDTEDDTPKVDLLRLERFVAELADYVGPIIFCDKDAPILDRILGFRETLPVEFPPRPESSAIRDDLWWKAVSALPGSLDLQSVVNVARQFAFSPGEIQDVAKAALSLAAARNPARPEVTAKDLYNGAVSQFRHNMDRYSTKPKNVFGWDDLILPDEVKTQLKRFESYIRHSERVFDDWGLGKRIGISGRGVKGLFTGKSGTGKTMAAQVIAATLGVELYKVDLAMMFNKYVGETEKSIKRVFAEARKSHGLILFDEADALFGKRRDNGNNRWMGMLVNYLLQEFEDYNGGAILTTNLPSSMDTAFNRRLHFVIEFPEPDEAMRLRLWKQMIPPELPIGQDVNLKRLARQFELTGGNIRNIVMGAAFMGAESDSPIGMLDMMRAVQDEFRKVGKTSTRSDFREFFDSLS